MKNITISNFFDKSSRKMISCLLIHDIISFFLNFRPQCKKNKHGKQDFSYGFSKFVHEELILSFRNLGSSLILCLLLFSSQIYGQFANVNPPTGGFAIDGGLRANTPTAGQGDWYPGAVNSGFGVSVFDNDGGVLSPATAQTSGRASGENYNGNDNIFTNGSKFNDYVSSLRWFTNSAPDKNDINNALYHVSRDPSNNQWIFVSGDRLSTNGTSYIDFELLQGTIVEESDGTFTGTPLSTALNGGGRTEKDIIISMEYTNGGSKPKVYIYQWMKSGSTWSYQQVTVTDDLLANAFAETNRSGAETSVPYSAFGSNAYQQFAFVEAAVNVTYLINSILGGTNCSSLNIKTLWVKTKASASSTAALKDYITPIPVDFRFGSLTIDPIAAKCANDNTAYLLSVTPPTAGTFTGSGVTPVAPNVPADGKYYFTPSAAASASNTITFVSTDVSCRAARVFEVKALPTITGNLNVCIGSKTQLTGSGTAATSNPWVSATTSVATVNATGELTGVSAGTSVITYTNSDGCQKTATVTVKALPTITDNLNVCIGSKTQLTGSGTAATSNPWVSATTSVATVNSTGEVTGVSDGTSVITYTNIDGCQKTATVRVNANPLAPSVAYNPPACDVDKFSITLSGVINGATYTVKNKDGNAISGIVGLTTATTYTGTTVSPVTFSNIPAGSGYQVSVSVNGCGSSVSSCAASTPTAIPGGKTAAAPKEAVTNDQTPNSGFDAYPVPFKDQLTIKYKFDYKSDVKIEVFNAQGMSVLTKTDTNSYLNKEVTLDLKASNKQQQVYLVKLTTNRETITKKVISSK
ncbi:Ig-like domain-containing protein [Flavobacterium sp. LB3P45]|uniref:Ig-like domain-containing protein n=1 Tax=Flavobacterium fructosi TaxID=3230416 RepID=A0ABW6HQX8_9FLAO